MRTVSFGARTPRSVTEKPACVNYFLRQLQPKQRSFSASKTLLDQSLRHFSWTCGLHISQHLPTQTQPEEALQGWQLRTQTAAVRGGGTLTNHD
jgi:hypothetical protein